MSKARANADATSQAYIENIATDQNLSGTYSTERLYFNDSYKLTGDVNVTGHLALGSVADSDVEITNSNDSDEREITGGTPGGADGLLESGRLMNDVPSLTGMTGELGSTVTGSPAITGFGTVTSGTIGSGVTMPADMVIQAVTAVKTTATTISTVNSWVTTGLTANITPRNSNSKVLVMVTGSQYSDVNDQTAGATIFRGSTNLGNADYGFMPTYFSWGTAGAQDLQVACSATVLDSPSSSSTVTYTVYVKTDKNTYRWGGLRTANSTITLLEISG